MTIKEKKAKAAAIAVACYMQLSDDCKDKKNCNGWRKVGRALSLKRRDLLRINGRVPSSYRLRM